MFDYSQPDASEVLSRYYEIGGQSQSAPLVPPEPLPSTASRMFDLFTHYSQGVPYPGCVNFLVYKFSNFLIFLFSGNMNPFVVGGLDEYGLDEESVG